MVFSTWSFPKRCVVCPRLRRLALRAVRSCSAGAARGSLPALRRSPGSEPRQRRHGEPPAPHLRDDARPRRVASAAAASWPSLPLPLRSSTKGLPARWSPPASSARCARLSARWRSALVLRSAQLAPALRTPPSPKPARCRFSSRGSPPIHGHSLERGFNQAELLARGWHGAPGVPALRCFSGGGTGARQSGLDRAARAANVRGAFALRGGCQRGTNKAQAGDAR